MRPVIVTTEFRGVFFGYVEGDTTGRDPIRLQQARCCIYWSGPKGIFSLAETGPNKDCEIGATCPEVELRKITAVMEMTPEAEKAWKEA